MFYSCLPSTGLCIKTIMSVVYALEQFSRIPHLQAAYATDETLPTHTFSYGSSFTQASTVPCVFITRGLIALIAISMS